MNLHEYQQRREELASIDRAEYRGDRPTFLYRYFNDNGKPWHRLLYIGITEDFLQRDEFHCWNSTWRRVYPITRVTLDEYPNRYDALEAERKAIRAEIPCHNGDHNTRRTLTHAMGDCPQHTTRNIANDMREALNKVAVALGFEAAS